MKKGIVFAVALWFTLPGVASASEAASSEISPDAAVCLENGTPVPCWEEFVMAGATGLIAFATLGACIGTAVDPVPGDEAFTCLASYGATTVAGWHAMELILCIRPEEQQEQLTEPVAAA